MRWRFIDPADREECIERNATIAKIDAWWAEFRTMSERIRAQFSQKENWDLPEWMERHLQAIDSRLMWEFGPAVKGQGHRLVITPESEHHLRPLVQAILDRAPNLDGWEFYPYRLAEDAELAKSTVMGRTGRDIADFEARISVGDLRRLDLTFTAPSIARSDDASALNAAFVAAESLLGEEVLDHWIGAIEVAPKPRSGGLKGLLGKVAKASPGLLPLDRLRDTAESLIGSLVDQLPPNPHYERIEDAEWTLWELKPVQADDYPGQEDLLVGMSINPEQWVAVRSDRCFASQRFSRCGELFCYVKIDGSEGLGEGGFADRAEIEDALDEVLVPAQLGCHIGGGTGLRYSYIDLALTDPVRGIEAIRDRLRSGRIPLRTWILFFDDDLAAEWVGVYEETPPPLLTLDE